MKLFSRFWQMKLWQRAVIVVVLLVVVWGIFNTFFGKKETTAQYQTATVQRSNLIATVSESGNVSANAQVSVTSPATGVVEDVYVTNGDTVAAGQNLFTVKATATPKDKATARANYLSAQNSLKSAQAKMNSLQSTLFQANQAFVTDRGISNPSDDQKQDPVYIQEQADWLQAEADYKNQEGVIQQMQASLESANLAYQETQDVTVVAPIDGSIANLSVKKGEKVSGASGTTSSDASSTTSDSSSSTSSSSVLMIGDFSKLSVVAQVNEVDIPKIEVGQNATVTLSAFSDKTFVGKVIAVDSVGTTSSGVVTYNVFIDLVAPPPSIKSGMSASITIQTAKRDDVLTVPTSAIQTSDGTSAVRVLKDGKESSVTVTTGIAGDSDTEITSGLQEGDVVITGTSSSSSGTSTTSPFSSGFGGGGMRGGNATFIRR
jgi:multidrug efflux pump subunit AcrA (membrane-fusion protein)